jgi:DNA-binding transcriptional ArsR family regulator
LSELASRLRTSPSSLQRELFALTQSDLLALRRDGRRTYYKANTASPVFPELRRLFNKTAGIVPTLQAELIRFGDEVTWAFIYGSIARDQEQAHSDVDLMVIGSISTADYVTSVAMPLLFGKSDFETQQIRRSGITLSKAKP